MTDRRPTSRAVTPISTRPLAAVLLLAAVLACAGCGGSTPARAEPASAASTPTSGTLPGAAASSSASGTNASAAPDAATGGSSGHQVFDELPVDTGRLLQTTLTGPVSGVTMKVWVWLPPEYDEPAYAHTAFPVLVLYPGGTGAGRNAWVGTSLGAREADARGAAADTLTPFVFVMPSMQLSAGLDTECADLPGQPKVGTFLAVDVRTMVQDTFRVIPGRGGWGAAGTSSGAYCASRLVFDHPDQYAALVSIGGYFHLETNLAGANDPSVRAGDPAAVAAASPPAVSVLLWAGGANDISVAQRFLAVVHPPTRAQLRIQPGGAHLTVDFAKLVPGTLAYLSQTLSHPEPLA